jgi:hypothetical protein
MTTKSSSKRSRKSPKTPRASRSLVYNNFGSPLPTSADVTFTYATHFQVAPSLAAPSSYQFNATGLFDPDQTGTGHQPLGFDQWLGTSNSTGFYQNYQVDTADIHVTAYSNADDSTAQAIICLGLSDDTSFSFTSIDTAMETPSFKTAFLGTEASCNGIVHLKHHFDASKFFGVPRPALYARTDLQAIYSANPTQNALFSILVQGPQNGTTPGAVTFVVQIKFRAHLTERKELNTS